MVTNYKKIINKAQKAEVWSNTLRLFWGYATGLAPRIGARIGIWKSKIGPQNCTYRTKIKIKFSVVPKTGKLVVKK